MARPTQRTGPSLAIVASCDGCEHFARGIVYAHCEHEGQGHPRRRGFQTAVAGPTDSPDWCPLLSPARLALAREIVAGAEPLALPLPGEAPINPKPATWDNGERR